MIYDSWISTEKVTHRLARYFKFPKPSGMEPVNSLRPRFLHPKIHTHKLSNSMFTTASAIAFYQKSKYMISGLHVFGSRGSNNPIVVVLIRTRRRYMLRHQHANQHFVCSICCKNLVSKLPWVFTWAMESLWWPTLMDICRKYNSQNYKGCQISNALWDGADQCIISKISAPKHTNNNGLGAKFNVYNVCIAYCYSFIAIHKNNPFKALTASAFQVSNAVWDWPSQIVRI